MMMHGLAKFKLSEKSCRLFDNVEIYCTARQATYDNKAHAQCILDNQGYKHTLRICNTYCYTIATMVATTCLNIAL